MKKNVVGHMMAEKEPVSAKIRRWSIFPRFICLLLALIIWLAITSLGDSSQKRERSNSPDEVTEQGL